MSTNFYNSTTILAYNPLKQVLSRLYFTILYFITTILGQVQVLTHYFLHLIVFSST